MPHHISIYFINYTFTVLGVGALIHVVYIHIEETGLLVCSDARWDYRTLTKFDQLWCVQTVTSSDLDPWWSDRLCVSQDDGRSLTVYSKIHITMAVLFVILKVNT